MKKLKASLVAAALLTGLLAQATPATALPATVPAANVSVQATGILSAKKTVSSKIEVPKAKTKVVTKPFRTKQALRIPVLKGSTAKNRKLFAGHVNTMVVAEKRFLSKWRSGLSDCRYEAYLGASVSAAVYKSRYASVTMTFSSDPGCGGVSHSNPRSFTLDLKTGKKVGISTFLDQDDLTTKLATVANLATKDSCAAMTLSDTWASESNRGNPIPRPDAWSVSSKGVRVSYEKYTIAAGACGSPSVVLPWSEVAPAKSMKGAVKSRVYVSDFKWNKTWGEYEGNVVVLSTQGRKVALLKGALLGHEASFCGLGVRSGRDATFLDQYDTKTKVKIRLADSSSNPKLSKSSLKNGLRLATAKETQIAKSYVGSTNAIRMCG
ncbi:RsiV family protein [Paeniglutamicibacter kerguelensis]|uniref:DUF3298 domain-containing protein n=1 Tax=Paeniglutamicibacter kerguelensis TaxID=254788 RepID=A0ABS4XGN8_9MICC|nr:RsiV family protein [Paeniglutamicibacter kerguelensis]MBP2387617.1 hypothetical protein [Paeniglutamicibacter kerguelensis]